MRILLVEDEKDLGKGIAKFLRSLKHTVRWAQDGATASTLLEQRAYDIAIIDLVLPGTDGVELIRQIHQGRSRGRPPVIVVTAHAERLPVDEPQHHGVVCEVLKKPKELTRARLRRAVKYCEGLLEEREDRQRGARLCDRLIEEEKLQLREGDIAVINIENGSFLVFRDEGEAIAYAKRRGGKRPYVRYFDTRLYTFLRRAKG